MRHLIVYAVILTFMAYAWRGRRAVAAGPSLQGGAQRPNRGYMLGMDPVGGWFASLCVLILFSAVSEHEDMPRSLLQIQGVSPWNGLFAMVFLAWLMERLQIRRPFNTPKLLKTLLAIYMVILVVALARAILDVSSYERYGPQMTVSEYINDKIINAFKYMLPGLLLFDACRTKRRVHIATTCVLGVAVISALMVIKRVPMETLLETGGDEWKVRRRINAVTGLHPNDLALILVVSMWSMVGFLHLLRLRWKIVVLGAFGMCLVAMALCYSRAGFIASIVVGLVLGAVGSRKLLLVILFGIVPAGLLLPGIQDRASFGFNSDNAYADPDDQETVTAGRMEFIWPICIEGIERSPIIGFGRHAACRVLVDEFKTKYHSVVGHCHNAYLDMLLDAGVIGLASALSILAYLMYISVRLLRSRGDPFARSIGHMGLSSLAAYAVMGLSGQRFFPIENLFVVYCIQGITLRVYVSKFLSPASPTVRKRIIRRHRLIRHVPLQEATSA